MHACAALAIAGAVACGFVIMLLTSHDLIGGKVRANIIVYIAYCLLLSAYTILITNSDDDDEDELERFV